MSRGPKSVILAVAAVCLVVSFIEPLIPFAYWNMLSIGRTILMFPLFVAGKYTSFEWLKGLREKISGWIAAVMIVVVIAAELLVYSIGLTGITWASHDHPASITEVAVKYLFYILSIVLFVGIYILMPQGPNKIITRWGRNSMTVYLFHLFICMAIRHFIKSFPLWFFPVAIVISIVITYVLSLDIVARIYNVVLGKVCRLLRL